MLLATVKNRWFSHRFITAILLAGLLHAFLFTYIVFTMRGMSQPYKVDMIFWGSILRKQDLQPQILFPGKEISKVLVLEPSKLVGVVQSKAWQLGVIVDKPVVVQPGGEGVTPDKFPTSRVELDDALPESVPGIPDAPRIPLRMPR